MVSGSGVLLLASIGGYWVLERAATHKGGLKRIGQILGGVIIAVSLSGVLCRAWYLATGKGGYYPMGKDVFCPFSPKSDTSSVQPK